MKKRALILTGLQLPIDYIMLLIAGAVAYELRYLSISTQVRPVTFDLPFTYYFILISIISTAWILIFAWFGLYTSRQLKFTQELSKIVQATSMSMMLVIVYMFFVRELFSSRFIVLTAWLLSILFVITGRLLLRYIKKSLYKKGIEVSRVLIIGKTRVTDILSHEYQTHQSHGVHIIDTLDKNSDIISSLHNYAIDGIIQTDPTISRSISSQIIDYCEDNHIFYKYVAGDFESKTTNTEVHTIAGIPLIELKRTPLAGWGRIIKRLTDIIGALVGILIFSPLMLLTAILIKIDSAGPIFADTPKRAGQFGKEFRMYKFRSMYTGAHKDQSKVESTREGLFKNENDPRRTRIGKYIRKVSIDEIPQFFNVLIGNMSLVGPRPHFLNEYKKEQLNVLDIKPGITGISQISGRSDLTFSEEVQLDNYYIENWSFWLDLWILLKTPIIVFTKIKSAV